MGQLVAISSSSRPQRIKPWKKWTGNFTPEWLAKRAEVSQGAKQCYARLLRFSGADGLCYPSMATLGEELGVSSRTARRYVRELISHGLVEVDDRRRYGKTYKFHFLDHPWMTEVAVRQPKLNDELGKRRISKFEQSCREVYEWSFPPGEFPDAKWRYWSAKENSQKQRLVELVGNEPAALKAWRYLCDNWQYEVERGPRDLKGYPTIGYLLTHCYTILDSMAATEEGEEPPDRRLYPVSDEPESRSHLPTTGERGVVKSASSTRDRARPALVMSNELPGQLSIRGREQS